MFIGLFSFFLELPGYTHPCPKHHASQPVIKIVQSLVLLLVVGVAPQALQTFGQAPHPLLPVELSFLRDIAPSTTGGIHCVYGPDLIEASPKQPARVYPDGLSTRSVLFIALLGPVVPLTHNVATMRQQLGYSLTLCNHLRTRLMLTEMYLGGSIFETFVRGRKDGYLVSEACIDRWLILKKDIVVIDNNLRVLPSHHDRVL